MANRLLPEDILRDCPQTGLALDNFRIRDRIVPLPILTALTELKICAASVSGELGFMDRKLSDAIQAAGEQLLAAENPAYSCPLPALQGGAGTSTNTCINELIAALASRASGRAVHPNDDVNRFQSTNDVYPTAVRIACLRELGQLAETLASLQTALQEREQEYAGILKIGRTQLQEAVPVTLGQEFGAWGEAVARDRWRVFKSMERLRQVNLGGSAVGTGINTPRLFAQRFLEAIRARTGLGLARAENGIDLTQNADLFVEAAGILKATAVNLFKISSDMRLLSSGPASGFGEIRLAAVQEGSTIMPGKVNPVIPELVGAVALEVMGRETTISMAAASGQLELNAFLPVIAANLVESIRLLNDAARQFETRCIRLLDADPGKCASNLESSAGMATLLSPYIGYERAAAVHEQARSRGISVRDAALASGLFTEEELDAVFDVRKATSPGIAGSDTLRERLDRVLRSDGDRKEEH